MVAGRKPDPDELQDAKGRPGKRRRAAPQLPAATPGGVVPSGKLKAAQLAVWQQLAPELERMNFLRPTDAQAFSRYCQTVERYWDATAKLDKQGAVYLTETPHGKMKRVNPLFLIQERLARRLTEFEDRFGLSPMARQQILLRLASAQPSLPLQPVAGQGAAATPEAPPPAGPLGILNRPAQLN